MQELIFVDALKGNAKGTGKPYNMVRLSDGIQAFTCNNPKDLDMSAYKEGDKVLVTFHVRSSWKGVEANIVEIKKAK